MLMVSTAHGCARQRAGLLCRPCPRAPTLIGKGSIYQPNVTHIRAAITNLPDLTNHRLATAALEGTILYSSWVRYWQSCKLAEMQAQSLLPYLPLLDNRTSNPEFLGSLAARPGQRPQHRPTDWGKPRHEQIGARMIVFLVRKKGLELQGPLPAEPVSTPC